MTTLQHRLGKAVRRLREAAGYSQEGFAAATGIHRTTMGRIERGAFNVTLGTLERLAKPLGISVSALIAEAESGSRGRGTSSTNSEPK